MRLPVSTFVILAGVVFAFGEPSISAQEAKKLDVIRQMREKFEKEFREMNEKYTKSREERFKLWKAKFAETEKENWDAYVREYDKRKKQIEAFQQREESLLRKKDAKQNGFFANIELKGRLRYRVVPMSFFVLPENQHVWYEVNVGDFVCKLDMQNNPALLKKAASLKQQIVHINGTMRPDNRLAVTAIKAAAK